MPSKKVTGVERVMYKLAVSNVERKWKRLGLRRAYMKLAYRDELMRIKKKVRR